MRTLALLLLVLAFTFATATKSRSQFTRYRSWNSRMYPVWKDGDPRFRNCWSGGEVTFDLKNDAPTLTGAKATFSINLNFPPNQTMLPDGQVVWAQNCTINGQQYQAGQAVYPDQDSQSTGVFPDGTPFNRSQNKKPHYVFVWKTWGRYWQVADGPSSSLTIGTDNVPLGSYNMEVVIYHCRGKDKFIPLGYASTVFTITDQVPFTISLAQVNDVNENDQNFIQNRAIAFSVKLHDPSQYLNNADISFSWDFGDSTGTLISRDLTVTHTYLTVGTFKPQVVLMASIPNGCGNPTAAVPMDASAAPAVVVMASTPAAVPAAPAEGGDAIALDVPASDATPLAASVQPAEAEDGEAVIDADTEAVEVASVAPAVVDTAVAPEEQDPADTAAEVDVAAEGADAAAGEVATAVDADAAAADIDAAVADTDAAAADTAAADADADTAAADADAAAADADTAAADADAAAADADTAAADADTAAADAAAADETAVAADETAVVADETAVVADETTVVSDAAEENEPVIDAAASVAPVAEGEEAAVEDAGAATVAPAAEVPVEQEVDVAVDAAADADAEVVQAETEAPADNIVAPAATEATAVEEAAPAADTEAEVQATENEAAAPAGDEEAVAAEGEVQAEAEADPAQVPLVVAKRQAPELTADCMVYRYGSLATSVDVIQGIESVEIVQMTNVVAMVTELDQNAVDVTITCQGSLPNEVCTVISDADCITPVETVCNAATPSPDCQMILRQFFNDSGVFCINVSLTNDVSLAVASARVSVTLASGGSPAGTAATVLGVMVLACVVCCIGLMYRRFKQYQPLREDSNGGSSAVTSVPMLLWNLLSRQSPGESRPLLQGRIV
ncbi:premelanosome protein a isoform X2 [Epinephelus fuscoguttatus]|uniref:premelanosome protein a isoform X2 n=1 Tax=Epinephelus fuscoguttatus TaxID=293821 RepID=UPI0020D081DF|nr:premelanosome protein a isoform X2 [Epinephelus fuscoguttatus]